MTQDPALEEHLQMQRDARLGAAVRAWLKGMRFNANTLWYEMLRLESIGEPYWANLYEAMARVLEVEAANGSG